MAIQIGILGVTGYTGEELLRLLSRHPFVELAAATSEQEKGKRLSEIYPFVPVFGDRQISSAEESLSCPMDVVFLCLPAIESAHWAKRFFEKKVRVIDLGADFRFPDAAVYEKWYKTVHPCPELLAQAVYGLTEWHRADIKDAPIIGNPGCYPTATLLGLLPLLKAGWLADEPIIIDAKSGISGAGKTPNKTTHYVEANENVNAYKTGRSHRHVGELDQELSRFSGASRSVIFTPHLVPQSRGLYASIYCKLNGNHSTAELNGVLRNAYAQEPFVKVIHPTLPGTRMAMNSNFCFLAAEAVADTAYAIIFSAIDNLGKGAAGQAVQNMNCMFGFEETTGL
jgi:N-acetyl-gamma-glutamyl-phosphate reductase